VIHEPRVDMVLATWQVVCSACGPVGREQEYKADADAIADRHREIQGTERWAHTRSDGA
jgi:hypothetical protein